MKFRKKPVVIEATQWFKLGDHPAVFYNHNSVPTIKTLEGEMFVRSGDWIITGVKGEHYPCKPDIFEMTYEPVEEAAPAQPPQRTEQEPVAWDLADKVRQDLDRQSCPDAFMRIAVESIVKHHTPQRTWVGLTDKVITKVVDSMPRGIYGWMSDWDLCDYARAIEAKLKEKNT